MPETPSANIMYPICDMVEYARTRLISVCVHAIIAAMTAETRPTQVTNCNAAGSFANTGNKLATKKTPATTMVAAWINAETGVGPSIASGSHICSGNIADLPAPPMKTNVSAHVKTETPRKEVV